MTQEEKATHSAQFILEEIHEQGEKGIEKLSNFLGYPPGVIASAFDEIFKTRKMAERKKNRNFSS